MINNKLCGLEISELRLNTPHEIKKRANSVNIQTIGKCATIKSANEVCSNILTCTSENNRIHSQEIRFNKQGLFWVSCDCEDFMYRWEYALSLYGATDIINSNGEPAKIRNPNNRPGVCKHIYKILSNMRVINLLDEKLTNTN